tara:strand:+ start:12195 stop:12911 length:717 start_codon:yes stop_codon:yes gene_type:complete
MFKPKALNYEIDTGGLSMNQVVELHNSLFVRKDYDWWYEILPGDTVVDIGAGIGAFSAKALDAGADRVYMIEPNRRLLKTAIKNVADYMMDGLSPKVIPINAAMGKTDIDLSNVHKSSIYKDPEEEPKLMSLAELIEYHDLQTIDYLRVDADGSEYNILAHEHRDYLLAQVRFIAVKVNLSSQYGGNEKFIDWKQQFLKCCRDQNRLFFQDSKMEEKLFHPRWWEHVPMSFMVYIKNW